MARLWVDVVASTHQFSQIYCGCSSKIPIVCSTDCVVDVHNPTGLAVRLAPSGVLQMTTTWPYIREDYLGDEQSYAVQFDVLLITTIDELTTVHKFTNASWLPANTNVQTFSLTIDDSDNSNFVPGNFMPHIPSSTGNFPGFKLGHMYRTFIEYSYIKGDTAERRNEGTEFSAWSTPMIQASRPLNLQACALLATSSPCHVLEPLPFAVRVHWDRTVSRGYGPTYFPPDAYQIEYYRVEAATTASFEVVVGSTTCERGTADNVCNFDERIAAVTGLYHNLPYYFRVRAGTIIGGGENSANITAMPTCLHSQGDENTTAVADCRCSAGYTGPHGDCDECIGGTYKDAHGSALCQSCPAGTYSGEPRATTCQPCPAGTHSGATGAVVKTTCQRCPAGTSASEDASKCLTCPAGTYRADTGVYVKTTCQRCPEGTYSNQTGATAETTCETCPAGKTTVQTGAHNISACQDSRVISARESENNAINVEDMVCMLCNSTQFCADGLAHPCPAHSVSGDSPSTVGDCVCEPGYLRESDTCAEGPPPYWYAGGVQYSCRTLSRTISALAGSARACVCVEGSAGAGWLGNCTECAVGTFNEGLNATRCEFCAPGSLNEATRSRNQSDCRCGVGSGNEGNVGPWGGPCECDAGWGGGDGSCLLCAAGKFKASTEDAECIACDPLHYIDTPGATACLACGEHSVSNSDFTACLCNAGYSTEGTITGTTTQTMPWSYNDYYEHEPSGLTLIAGVTYTINYPAWHPFVVVTTQAWPGTSTTNELPNTRDGDSITFTIPTDYTGDLWYYCQAHENMPGGRVHYTVPAPASAAFVVCSACPADHFKETEGQSACETCEDYSWAPAGNTLQRNCLCNVGYEQKSAFTECTACEAGKYKDFYDDDDDTGRCEACPEHANSPSTSVLLNACVCNVGFEGDDGKVCTACAAGTFWQAILGGSECENCPAGKYQPNASATACESCYASADSPEASTSIDACECNAGYTYVESLLGCSGCAAGKFQTAGGCQTCAEGTFTAVSAMTACESCPATVSTHNTNYEDGVNHTHCVCALGYHCREGPACQNGDCIACPADTYQPDFGDTPVCRPCTPQSQSQHTSDESSDCQCNHGYHATFGVLPETCTACAPGTYSDELHVRACSPCADDTIAASAAQTACVPCHDNAGTYNGQREVCMCDPGHYLLEGSCSPCPVDMYKDVSGDQVCTACPDHSASPEGSVEREKCKCLPGYGEVSPGSCVLCDANHFKETTDNVPCTSCGTDLFITTTGSRNQTDCVCAPGETLEADQCQDCAANYYKPEYANSSCTVCKNHSKSPEGTEEQRNCKCVSGYGIAKPEDASFETPRDPFLRRGGHSFGVTCHGNTPQNMDNDYGNGVCNSYGAGRYIEMSLSAVQVPSPSREDGVLTFGNGECIWDSSTLSFTNMPCVVSCDNEMWPPACTSTDCPDHPDYDLHRDQSRWNGYWGEFNWPYNRHTSIPVNEIGENGVWNTPGTSIQRTNPDFISPAIDACPFLAVEIYAWTGEIGTFPTKIPWRFVSGDTGTQHPFQNGVKTYGWPVLCSDSENRIRWFGCLGPYMMAARVATFKIHMDTQFLFLSGSDPLDGPAATCEECVPGTAKNKTVNSFCDPCDADTFAYTTGVDICPPCPAHSSTHGKTGQALCECVLGHERRWEDSAACEACREGTFKTTSDVANRNCSLCGACSSNEYVAQTQHVCIATQDIICTACAANSWLEAGQQGPMPCFCNAGYESSSESTPYSSLCVACNIGSFRGEDFNNTVPCAPCPAGTFTGVEASKSCAPHTPNCNATPGTYVLTEGNTEQDIQCVSCQTCFPGEYANRTCGVDYRNNRADTDCVLCEPGYYCDEQQRHLCPIHTESQPGSAHESDCTCKPGFYMSAGATGMCTLCEVDHFCIDEVQRACPAHSITLHTGSAHVLDCNCRRGFYRLNVTEFVFECHPCSQDDWCFNNTANNCSDDRMETDPKAWHPGNCTCVEGWYNTDFSAAAVEGRCELCPIDTYCVDGRAHPCALHKWTQDASGSTNEEACLCIQGRYLDGEACLECPKHSFCPGDGGRTACHNHSVTRAEGSSSVDECLCSAGYAHADALEPSCALCATETNHNQDGFWKAEIGNEACAQCDQCRVDSDSQFLLEACSAAQNAVCDACDNCLRDDVFAGLFIQHICEDRIDTVCANCTRCELLDWHYEKTACTENSDTDCQVVVRDADDCQVGQYRGNHGAQRQSKCLPCSLRIDNSAPYRFSSTGQIYDDALSCDVQCLGLSVRRNISDYSAGCQTCETGNVLLKLITVVADDLGTPVTCSFTCRPGYVRVDDDCMLASVTSATYALALEVVQFEKTSDGFRFDVHHSNHSRFVVVVGPTAPVDCSVLECCWRGLWRVSTLHQMGLRGGENCSAGETTAALAAEWLTPSALRFEVREADLGAVANCSEAVGGRECALAVSVVDVVHRRVKSQTVRLRVLRSDTHVVHVRGHHTYVPLSMFAVDVQPFVARGATMVFLVVTRVQAAVNVTINMRVREMQAVSLTEEEDARCGRFGRGRMEHLDGSVELVAGETRVLHNYWIGAPGALHALYALEQFSDASPDVMDVAAVRNTTGQLPACQAAPPDKLVVQGTVSAAVGLGAAVVASMAPLAYNSTSTASTVSPLSSPGELGHLLSLWAVAVDDAVRSVQLQGLLAVYVRGEAARGLERQRATQLVKGKLDFTRTFRRWCNARPNECVYEYLRPWNLAGNVLELHCPDTGPDAGAAAWIRQSFGAVHDAGHVAALCQLQRRESRVSLLVLVHSMRFMLRATGGWGRDVVFGGQQSESVFWPLVGFETGD